MERKLLRRLRAQFIAVMLLISALFLAFITIFQYESAKRSVEKKAENALRNTIMHYNRGLNAPGPGFINQEDSSGYIGKSGKADSTETADGMSPNGKNERPDFDGSDPVFDSGIDLSMTETICSVYDEDGNFYLMKNDIFYVDDSDIETYSSEASKASLSTGTISGTDLRYMKENTNNRTVIAFTDVSRDMEIVNTQLGTNIRISLVIFFILSILSIFFSIISTKPIEKAWKDQKQFVADASHELKTPLTVISSNVDMLLASSENQSDKTRERLDNIKDESGRMKELVNELLDVARGDMAKTNLVLKDTDLSYVVLETLLMWEPVAFEKGRTINQQIAEDAHVLCDEDKMKQLINILIDNAIKYSDENSTINVELRLGGKHAYLSVSDTGVPLSDEEISHLFDRFYRADASRESTPGYGLGLSIAAQIAAMMNGKLWATCEGNVTTFHFSMHLKKHN